MASDAAQAAANVVPAGGNAAKPNSKSPVCGAAVGRSGIVTATTTVMIAETIDPKPSHVIQPSLWISRILAIVEMTKYATNPNATEHVACFDTAFKAIDKPKVDTPAQMLRQISQCEKGGQIERWDLFHLHPSDDVKELGNLSGDGGPLDVPFTPLQGDNSIKIVSH